MRAKMERFVLLPFSVGCVSESSIDVSVQQPRKSKADTNPIHPILRAKNEFDEELYDDESLSGESNKRSFRSLSLPKTHISTGIHKLLKGFKNLSQYFVYKEEMEEVEMEMEIEIGVPTDVKHVTHIGWDGSVPTAEEAFKAWPNLVSPDFLSVPFQFSMVHDLIIDDPITNHSHYLIPNNSSS